MKYISKLRFSTFIALIIITLSACDDSYLTETPKDFLSPDNTYVDAAGFEAAMAGLYANARGYQARYEGIGEKAWEVLYGQGADIGFHIDNKNFITDYSVVNSSNGIAREFWIKSYSIVKDANAIITRANAEESLLSEDEKSKYIAEAKFFRAFAYRVLVWFYGDVPIVAEELTAPKYDFTRDPVQDVLDFMLEDLEYASEFLPQNNPNGAKLSKAAADYLLAETYIATQQWDKAISAADRVINDPQYDLMYDRFGSMSDKPGNVYWDLFRLGNQDRSAGNKENIFAWQFEYNVNGGSEAALERAWGPFLERLVTPDGKSAILKDDRLGRPVCFIRITPWVETGMWDDFDNDIRNSEENVQRTFYINNPASAHFGEAIEQTDANHARFMYPYYKKFTHPHGHPQGYDPQGRTFQDWYVFRVAGVYLLRAEAYLGKGDNAKAAEDINAVRGRAKAQPVSPANVDIDYILDERARELLGEEYRRVTLNRLGKLVERTKLHNPVSGVTIQDFNNLLPIPQNEIDANTGAVLEQNPGYN